MQKSRFVRIFMGQEMASKEACAAKRESRKARIFDDEIPVCTLGFKGKCYDPNSLKRAFHPLGIFSKGFGLFPCYDFSFVDGLSDTSVKMVHILDYCYSGLIFLFLTGGALACYLVKPRTLQQVVDTSHDHMDYYVHLTLIYATIFSGVQSLFIFPTKWSEVLNFVKLFSSIDKILRFDGRMEERWFAKKVLLYLIGCLVFTLASFLFVYAFDASPYERRFTDYLMGPVMTLALMALITPTGLAVFFLNAMRLRMMHFNRKLVTMLSPVTPSSFNCSGFQDYGKELDQLKLEKRPEQFALDLEKMRILHCEIRAIGCCMSCIFGGHLVRDFLYSFVALILYTYLFIYLLENGGEGSYKNSIIYAGQNAFILLKILVLVCFAQFICCQGKFLKLSLQRVALSRLNDACTMQVQAFITSLDTYPTISAAGFFNVNKALMTSILGSITTYFIILIQFKLSSVYGTGINVKPTNSSGF